jgi:hypothetical protein
MPDASADARPGGFWLLRRFRDPIAYALETDWPVGAKGFEPCISESECAKTLSSGREDSNLCISKSSKRRIWTVSWSPQAVQ